MNHQQPEPSTELLCASLRDSLPEREEGGVLSGHGRLAERFLAVAQGATSRPALRTSQNRWTYADLLSMAESVTAKLVANHSFRPGDRVVLMAPNSADYIAGFYGTLLAGGVVVPIPIDLESTRLQAILEATEATIALTTDRVQSRWPETCRGRFQPVGSPTELAVTGVNIATPPATDPDELAAIFFTSGSSGLPKGVMLSHRNLLSNAESIQQYLEIDHTERALTVLPFPHAFGNSILQSHLLAGAELVLEGSPVFPESILDALSKYQCTSFSAVPDLFRTLCERTSLGQRELPNLRYMAVAGGALPHETAVQISRNINPARFFAMYGQTEATARLAYLPPDELADLPGCLGQGIPGVQLQVVDGQGRQISPGELGEIRARGPNIMLGYWRDPVASAEILRDGWLHTGDLATIDEAGRIFVRGRKSALIKIAGYRIHPREIEDFVLARCAVRQAVVVPFENKQAGDTRLALFARPSSEDATAVSESDLMALCRQHLPRYRVPEIVQIVSQFPLTSSLKIDRQQLAQIASLLVSDRLRVA